MSFLYLIVCFWWMTNQNDGVGLEDLNDMGFLDFKIYSSFCFRLVHVN